MFVEARADDDFGLLSLQLKYSVNGGPERTIGLYDSQDSGLKEVSAGHTFFLEELELEPGDFVSYYAASRPTGIWRNRERTSRATCTSSRYGRSAKTSGLPSRRAAWVGPVGRGRSSGSVRSAAEIVAGTFNVVRDRENYTDEEYRENLVFLTLAQGGCANRSRHCSGE